MSATISYGPSLVPEVKVIGARNYKPEQHVARHTAITEVGKPYPGIISGLPVIQAQSEAPLFGYDGGHF